MKTISAKKLEVFSTEILVKAGIPRPDAEIQAVVLVWANLRGIDSHGVLRIPLYLKWLEEGIINRRPNIQVEKETAATLLIDADRALGPVVTVSAMTKTISKAKEAGICWCLIRNTTHQGAMAYYTQMAAKHEMAGIASICSVANMAPHGARTSGISNSPIAIAVPGQAHDSISLDMATSVAAGGKIELAKDKGMPIPNTWALDSDGNPTTNPHLFASVLPFGGAKGSGLATMFECLSSIMVGNPLLQPNKSNESNVILGVQNGFIAAIDIATFTDIETYKNDIDRLINGIKSLPKSDGTEEIFVPGEIESRIYKDRSKNGIPLPPGTVTNLLEAANQFNVPLPSEL